MSGPAAILRELHRLRRHVKDLSEQIERLPRQLKLQQIKAKTQEDLLKQAQETIKKLKVAAHEKEVAMKAKQADIAKREKQRNEAVANKKEYDALTAEIDAAKAACQQLEDEVFANFEETDKKSAQLPELEKALKQAQYEVANFDKVSQERAGVLRGQLEQSSALLKEVEPTLPAEVLQVYLRQVQSRGEDALAAAQNKTCQACYTSLTSQMHNEMLQGMLVLCKSCGRILYLTE